MLITGKWTLALNVVVGQQHGHVSPPSVGQLLRQNLPSGRKDVVRVGPEGNDVLGGLRAKGPAHGEEGVAVLDGLGVKVVERPVDEVADLELLHVHDLSPGAER